MATKKQRIQILNKSGGVCWYCGHELPAKGWHVDHVIPQNQYSEKHECLVHEGKKFTEYGLNDLRNLVPACAPCNLFKTTYTVDQFRREIEAQIDRARKSSVNFRTAERFGLIKTNPKEVNFWFEQQEL